MWTLIEDARRATSLGARLRALQEIVAYVMQTGPRGGQFYFTPNGKKVYRKLGGKTGDVRKLRQLKGESYDSAWRSLSPDSHPVTRPSGEAVGRALKGIFGNRAPDPKMLGEMFSDQGMTAEPRHIGVSGSGKVSVSYTLRDSNGEHVGDMIREFYRNDAGEPEVYHDWFTLEDQFQGGGRAGAMLGKALKAYKQMGVKKVTVTAALSAGPYTWARFGFNMPEPRFQQRKDQFGAFLQHQLGVPKEHADRILSRVKDMHDLSGVHIQRTGQDGTRETIKAGKDFLLHGDHGQAMGWQGEFDLSDPKAVSRWQRQAAKGRAQRKKALEAGTAHVPMSQDRLDKKRQEHEDKTAMYRRLAERPRPGFAQAGGPGALDLMRRLGSRPRA